MVTVLPNKKKWFDIQMNKATLSLFVVLFLGFGLLVTVIQLGKQQDLSQHAAGGNVTVTVNASSVTQTLSPNFLGINYVGFWDGIQGSAPSQQALAQTGIRTVRFPGGAPADWYDWKNPKCQNWSTTSPLDLWNFTKGIGAGAKALFQTNFQGNSAECNTSGVAVNAPSYQADWVTYNKQQGMNYYMEVGNEEDVNMNSWHNSNFQPYITAFSAQAQAMHQADPTVKVYGPAATNEWYWWNATSGSPDSLGMFLAQTGNKTGSGQVDGISLHFYKANSCSGAAGCWTDSMNAAQYWQSSGGPWQAIKATLAANDTRSLPVNISEWNIGDSDSGTGFNQTVGHALVIADTIGSFAQSGVAEEDYFALHGGLQYGILYGTGESQPQDRPNPTYYTMVLWGKMGKYLLNLTQSSDPSTVVSSYATKKDDGSIQVMSINKTNVPQNVTYNFQNAGLTSGTAKVYSLTPASDYASTTAQYNGATMPSPQSPLPNPTTQSVSNNSLLYLVPAYSAVVIDIVPEGVISTPTPTIPVASPTPTVLPATPTPTRTPTPIPATPTPTPTATPTPKPPTATPTPGITGDITKDGKVDAQDLSYLLSNWNTANSLADLSHDGKVDAIDLSILLSNWKP